MVMAQVDVMGSGIPWQASGDSQEIERLRNRIQRLAKPCGCTSGAALMLFALVGWPVEVIAHGIPHTVWGGAAVVAEYFAIVLAAAVVGKGGGIIVGLLRRRRYQRRLRNLLSTVTRAGD